MRRITNIRFVGLLLSVFCCVACMGQTKHNQERKSMTNSNVKNQKEIYLAGGCFWGTEHFIKLIDGVISTEVGYANSITPNPTYEEVCTGRTEAAETVHVVFDSDRLPLELLLGLYFETIDPTALNRQGGDRGTQYRTGIYYTDTTSLPTIRKEIAKLQAKHTKAVVIEVMPLKNFYPAELYHQDYLDKNPAGYCHIPQALFKIARNANKAKPNQTKYTKPSDEELRRKLTALQYEVTQRGATERAFQNEYYDEFGEGIYVDITTGEPLFLSTDKFESGCGWPAFSKPIDKSLLSEFRDTTHGMIRTEVRSVNGGAHLGHVFEDGPKESGGLRYCINSASLRFIPRARMKEEGYGAYLPLLK